MPAKRILCSKLNAPFNQIARPPDWVVDARHLRCRSGGAWNEGGPGVSLAVHDWEEQSIIP